MGWRGKWNAHRIEMLDKNTLETCSLTGRGPCIPCFLVSHSRRARMATNVGSSTRTGTLNFATLGGKGGTWVRRGRQTRRA
jgi:hypothetical protein